MAKLKPCPFCGEPPSEHKVMDESLFSHSIVEYLQISCAYCGINMHNEDHAEARACWNQRKRPRKAGTGEGR